jgi:hypothetical protein
VPAPLRLDITDYLDATRWRWALSDDRGRFVADHTVRLDPTSREYAGFRDLGQYLDYHQPIAPVERQLADLGVWIGAEVFGGLREAFWQRRATPAVAVQVHVPGPAHELLLRPFELARFADGRSFREAGVRFVYALAGAAAGAEAKAPAPKALRILAAFSLPVAADPLNLRRERYGLQRLARDLRQTRGLAVELRVLQYGATRATLQDALEEDEGWDIVHLSGHGARGELLLEDDRGGRDPIGADELGSLLDPARAQLKLLILDACYSAAGSHAAARRQVGLDAPALRQPAGEAAQETAPLALPGLAQALAGRLGCAVLAMRYPVGDAFAAELMLALYEKLLDKRRPLPAALNLALEDALHARIPIPSLAPVTPILVGPAATDLRLAPPAAAATGFVLPPVGLGIAFPDEPPRLVGRLQPMLRASQALARESAKRGVLFYGMPGAGKTTCALELAYRHEHGRFAGYVWYKAPEAGSDIGNALFNLLQDIQTQLNAPDLGLTTALADPAHFRAYTLPRLRALLQQNALLLALDNLETLLTDSNRWRDPLWGEVVGALLAHNGPSRVILTARRRPADLAEHPRLQVEPIHALSFAESVLLARELPHLARLFDDDAGRALLRETLRVAQGHPKLLELADGLAADRDKLAGRVQAAAGELAGRGDVLDAFFAAGVPAEGETRQADAHFVQALQGWTMGVARGLSPTTDLLFAFLCRLEPEDRRQDVVERVWPHFLKKIASLRPAKTMPDSARNDPRPLAESEHGLDAALAELQAAGLAAVARPELDPAQLAGVQALLAKLAAAGGPADGLAPAALTGLLDELASQATTYTIHPGVAEAARAAAGQAVLDAADIALGNYHIAVYQHGLKTELTGGGPLVVAGGRRAAPYLLRQARWAEASTLLERMLARDRSPATLAFALPLLRRIADATAGTARELIDAGVLANALAKAGRAAEAEAIERDLISRSVEKGNYRQASANAGALLNLLRSSGRLAEALQVAAEMAGYTRQAGLGPWTQLADEAQRLQVLAAMGRYDEVLAAVQAARPQMAAVPEMSAAEETVAPWNVREGLLHTGLAAAVRSERWADALALNAERVQSKQARGAAALELARARFDEYGPLLRLGRFADVRSLLLGCRSVFEEARAVRELGAVYSALAGLEDTTGGPAQAVRWEEVALGYRYQAGDPEDCAISHNNLATTLKRGGATPAFVLAHRLAACILDFQTQSGGLSVDVNNLANSDLPPSPPAFAAVVAAVEQIEGVRFAALFARLPRAAPDGDAAIAAVWRLAQEEKAKRAERTKAILQQFEPLLQLVAAAVTNAGLRPQIEALLPQLEQKGWRLTDAVRRIWAGERDAQALTAGLDGQDSALVRRVLEIVES